MNKTTDRSVSNEIKTAPFELNIWLGCFILITGNISTFGNIIIFSSRAFRNRACTVYLLVEAIVLIFFFDLVLLTRTLQKGFRIPVLSRYDAICRLRYFASQYTNLLAISLFILATTDRYLSTHRSQVLRKWSGRTSLAYKLVLACVIIWFVFGCHRLVLYSATTGSCIAQPGLYALLDNYLEAVISGLCPPVIIFVLSYLLMRSVRNTIQRQNLVLSNEQNSAAVKLTFLRKTDKQLTRMLLWQTLVAIPAFIPYTVQLIYSNVTENWSKSPEWVAWENVCVETIRLLSYTFFSTRLYITLISSGRLRREIFRIFRLRNDIQPTDGTLNTMDQTTAGGLTTIKRQTNL
ncbi:unnamed protein product [Adineta ricciae]|uniref:G-protein coupled receptors family 1 profile domain-containing protein n=1 Tax=Adineta ricciae TaxID=249248 RepID=A0A813VNU7_ADIRI|nr:unnamed protein product [Adineta ricciae]